MAKTTHKAVEALKAKGAEFPEQLNRLELAKKDERGVPQSTGKHRVTFIRDERRDDIRQYTGSNSYKEVTGIRYWFNEDGTEKFYDVPLVDKTSGKVHYLIVKFDDINEGDRLEIEYVKKGERGYVNVAKVGEEVPSIQLDGESDEKTADGMDGSEDISLDDIPF